MKVITYQEYKYFPDWEDKKKLEEALGYEGTKKELACLLGISQKQFSRKLSPNVPSVYFDHLEILMLEKHLGITFDKH